MKISICLLITVVLLISACVSYGGVASTMAEYDSTKKYPAVGWILSFFIFPGLGNVYAYNPNYEAKKYFSSSEKEEFVKKRIWGVIGWVIGEGAMLGLAAGIFSTTNGDIGSVIGCFMWPLLIHFFCASDAASEVKKYNKMIAEKIDEYHKDTSSIYETIQNKNLVRGLILKFPLVVSSF